METKFTTPRGAKITLTLVGTNVVASVAGRGDFEGANLSDGFIHATRMPAKIEVPAAAMQSVKALFDARTAAVREEYLKSDDCARERMYARMYAKNSNH